MKHLLTLGLALSCSLLSAQCTVSDLDFDSLSVRWADGFVDTQGHTWGAAFVSDGSSDVLALRLDAAGAVVWSKRYSALNPFVRLFPTTAVPSADGGMLIIGHRTDPTHENYFGIKVDMNGELQWSRIYMEPLQTNDAYGTAPVVCSVPAGGYQFSIPYSDGIISARLGEDGSLSWVKRIAVDPYLGTFELADSKVDAAGNLYFVTAVWSYPAEDTVMALVIKTDAQCTPEWSTVLAGAEFKPQALCIAASGEVVVGGVGDPYGAPVQRNSFVARLDATGGVLWHKDYGDFGPIDRIAEGSDGELFLACGERYWYVQDTLTLIRSGADGTVQAGHQLFGEMVDCTYGGCYWLPNALDVLPSPGQSVRVMMPHQSVEDGPFNIRMMDAVDGSDLSCGMIAATMTASPLAGVYVLPTTVTTTVDTMRTWTLAIAGIDQTTTELAAFLYGSGSPRPGFQHSVHGGVWNIGGSTSGPTNVTLSFDPLLSFVSANPLASSVTGNTVTWVAVNGMEGFESRYFSTTFAVPADTALLGDAITTTLTATQDSTESTLDNNTATITQTVVGSYDPNDKLVFPKDYYHIENDSVLDYTIRFQNTGTFMAETVVIRDTLPLDLDVMTFRIGAASHAFTYSLGGNGILEVRFDNINLPDSNTNEPMSHGMVGFRIKPILPLALGQEITNAADIYFDFNPPIHTPDATVVVTDETGLRPVVKPEKLTVYPVPVRTMLSAALPLSFKPVSAFAVGSDGRRVPLLQPIVLEKKAEYNVQQLPPGAYVLTLIDRNGRRMSARFTKE